MVPLGDDGGGCSRAVVLDVRWTGNHLGRRNIVARREWFSVFFVGNLTCEMEVSSVGC